MLVVKLEMHPCGQGSRRRDIGTLNISNVGGDWETGDYVYNLTWDERSTVSGRLLHRREDGAWSLVRKCLNDSAGVDL